MELKAAKMPYQYGSPWCLMFQKRDALHLNPYFGGELTQWVTDINGSQPKVELKQNYAAAKKPFYLFLLIRCVFNHINCLFTNVNS